MEFPIGCQHPSSVFLRNRGDVCAPDRDSDSPGITGSGLLNSCLPGPPTCAAVPAYMSRRDVNHDFFINPGDLATFAKYFNMA